MLSDHSNARRPRLETPVMVGQVWRHKKQGDRWLVEQRNPYGESGTYLMRAVDGRHEGKTDVLFGAEVVHVAELVEVDARTSPLGKERS